MPAISPSRLAIAAAVGLLCLAIPAPAPSATNNIEDIGASERINYSGKLRMLSQRIAVAACNTHAGVAPDQSRQMLAAVAAEFAKIVDALEFGDEDLRIQGAESRRKTLAAIADVRAAWAPVQTAAAALLRDGQDTAAVAAVAASNMALLEAAKRLVSELSGQYSDPTAMLQADAMLVDISGRQRMLSQKMSKEVCQIWSQGGDAETEAALAKTMQIFEVSLLALRDGLASAGIKPAPTYEIRAGLEGIYADWRAVKPTLETVAKGDPATTPELRRDTLSRLDTVLEEMNDVVGLYTLYAKTGL